MLIKSFDFHGRRLALSFFALSLFVLLLGSSSYACPALLKEVAAVMKPVSAGLLEDADLTAAGLNVNKHGPHVAHNGQKLSYTMLRDHQLGTVRFQPSVEKLSRQLDSVGEARQIFAPDFELANVDPASLPDRARVPYDAQVIVPAFHGGGTIKSNGKTMLIPMDILTADPSDATSDLKRVLINDPMRMQLAVESIDLPGSGLGPSHEDFVDFDSFMQWLKTYFLALKATGKPVVPITRSASTGYLIEFHRRHPNILDGLIVMSPMHPQIGYQAGIDALREKYKDEPEALSEASIAFVEAMYGDMDWSNLSEELGDLDLLILVGGQDDQVPVEVRAFYEELADAHPNRQMMYVEDAGHDLYSFQDPHLSRDVYFETQAFLFKVRFPELYEQFREARDHLLKMIDEQFEDATKREHRLTSEKARAKVIGDEIAQLNPLFSRIEEEYYLRAQLAWVETQKQKVVPPHVVAALNGYRHLDDEGRNGVQELIQPFVSEYRSELASKKAYKQPLEEGMMWAQVVVLRANNFEFSQALEDKLAAFETLNGNDRRNVLVEVEKRAAPFSKQLPSWADIEADLIARGEPALGYTSDPEFIALQRELLDLESSRDLLNKNIAETLQDEARLHKKAAEKLRKTVRALRHDVVRYANGQGPVPDFGAVMSWSLEEALAEALEDEAEARRVAEERKANGRNRNPNKK